MSKLPEKIVYKDYTEYRLNGQLHREDGPAVEYSDGTKVWWVKGKLHREDGPAFEHPDGRKQWWVNHERIKQVKK